uniref:Ig-like domain-containing protein n=1 Tax=Astatotilapia calliptera TaxID=8154 RepID=A0AAX7V4X9_ASTCA
MICVKENLTMAPLFMIITHRFVSLAAVSSGMFVVTQSPDVSVMEGETVNITCCWAGTFERFRVNWLKNQTVIKREAKLNQSHGSLKKEAKTCSPLNISNIRTEDSGTMDTAFCGASPTLHRGQWCTLVTSH